MKSDLNPSLDSIPSSCVKTLKSPLIPNTLSCIVHNCFSKKFEKKGRDGRKKGGKEGRKKLKEYEGRKKWKEGRS